VRHKSVSYAKYGYIFCIPFVAAFLIFSLYPIVYTIVIGFTDLKGVAATTFHFLPNPLQNFNTILHNPSFQVSLRNTAVIWIINFIPQIVLALLLTAWFTNERLKIKGQGAFKVLLFMPNIITAGTIAVLFGNLFGFPVGPVNQLLVRMGFLDQAMNFAVNKNVSRGVISFIQFWMWYGNTMIVLIAGVLGISPTLYEAASIDGANNTQAFFRITLPLLRTILLYTLITALIGGLTMFDIPRLYLNGGPDNATLTTSLFIYNQAFSGSYLYARASAAAVLLFIIIAILSAFLFRIMRDKDAALLKKQQQVMLKAERSKRKAAASV